MSCLIRRFDHGHLPVHHPLRTGHVSGVGAGDDFSANRVVVAQSVLRQVSGIAGRIIPPNQCPNPPRNAAGTVGASPLRG